MVPVGDDEEQAADVSSRVKQNEPLVDTVVLDEWLKAELPLRGEMRKKVLARLRKNIRNRRTVEGIASRISSAVTRPITNAIQEEAEDRIQQQVVERAKKRAEGTSEKQ